jgi:transducin (beta)-like 1
VVLQENDITTEYQMLAPQDLMIKDIDELRQLVLDKKEERKEKQERQQKPKKERKQKQEQQDKQERQQERQERQQQEKQERQQKQEKQEAERADAMEVDDKHVEITQVTTFAGHSSEVFICAWSPTEPLLASG